MYCPNCGSESTPGFKYCKRCGGNLTETAQMAPPLAPPTRSTGAVFILAAATVAITLGGLGIVFTNALSMVAPSPPGFSAPASNASITAGMMVMFGSITVAFVAIGLIKLFARIMGLPSETLSPFQSKRRFASDYKSAQLPSPPAGVTSVTEHTTRNFRPPVYDEVRGRE